MRLTRVLLVGVFAWGVAFCECLPLDVESASPRRRSGERVISDVRWTSPRVAGHEDAVHKLAGAIKQAEDTTGGATGSAAGSEPEGTETESEVDPNHAAIFPSPDPAPAPAKEETEQPEAEEAEVEEAEVEESEGAEGDGVDKDEVIVDYDVRFDITTKQRVVSSQTVREVRIACAEATELDEGDWISVAESPQGPVSDRATRRTSLLAPGGIEAPTVRETDPSYMTIVQYKARFPESMAEEKVDRIEEYVSSGSLKSYLNAAKLTDDVRAVSLHESPTLFADAAPLPDAVTVPAAGSGSSGRGPVIGGAIAGIVALLAIGIGVVMFLRKRKKRAPSAPSTNYDTSDLPTVLDFGMSGAMGEIPSRVHTDFEENGTGYGVSGLENESRIQAWQASAIRTSNAQRKDTIASNTTRKSGSTAPQSDRPLRSTRPRETSLTVEEVVSNGSTRNTEVHRDHYRAKDYGLNRPPPASDYDASGAITPMSNSGALDDYSEASDSAGHTPYVSQALTNSSGNSRDGPVFPYKPPPVSSNKPYNSDNRRSGSLLSNPAQTQIQIPTRRSSGRRLVNGEWNTEPTRPRAKPTVKAATFYAGFDPSNHSLVHERVQTQEQHMYDPNENFYDTAQPSEDNDDYYEQSDNGASGYETYQPANAYNSVNPMPGQARMEEGPQHALRRQPTTRDPYAMNPARN